MKEQTGRKTKYYTHVAPRFEELKRWLERGATDKEIIKALKIAESTYYSYLKEFPEFSELLKKHRRNAVEEIKYALYRSAVGFEYEEKETTTVYIKLNSEIEEILIKNGVDTVNMQRAQMVKEKMKTKYVLPNPTSALMLLKHWDKENEWTSDPQLLKFKREEFDHKKDMDKNSIF